MTTQPGLLDTSFAYRRVFTITILGHCFESYMLLITSHSREYRCNICTVTRSPSICLPQVLSHSSYTSCQYSFLRLDCRIRALEIVSQIISLLQLFAKKEMVIVKCSINEFCMHRFLVLFCNVFDT